MSIYEIIKRVIARGNYNAEDIRTKMDAYLLYDRITFEQYAEINGLKGA